MDAGYRARRRLEHVEVRVRDEDGRSHLSGVARCGSVWSCPVCATQITLHRTRELHEVLERHVEAGHGAWFCTMTVPHERHDRLRYLRRGVSGAWRRVRQAVQWRRRLARLGYVGDVRVLEVTVGPRSGWHPHLHALLVFERQPTDVEREAFEDWLFGAWSAALEREGLERPKRWGGDGRGGLKALGVSVEDVRTGPEELSQYVLKMGVSFEVASWTAKRGRGGSRSIMQLLADVHRYRDPVDCRLWREWSEDMKGARQMTWSQGKNSLRKYWQLGAELEDEEVVYADDGEGEVVCELPRETFRRFSRVPAWIPHVLMLAEMGGGPAVLQFVRRCSETWLGRHPPRWYQDEVLTQKGAL